MIAKITKTFTRTYSDSGRRTAYVEWIDANGSNGRTEGKRDNGHMAELFRRAQREGVKETNETW